MRYQSSKTPATKYFRVPYFKLCRVCLQDFGESQSAAATKSSSAHPNSNLTIIKRFNHHSTRILKTAQDHTRSLQASDKTGEIITNQDQTSENKVGVISTVYDNLFYL